MKLGRTIILAAILGLIGQAAYAFQETKGTAQQDDATKNGPDAKLSAPPPSTSGPELKVPGFGSIGVLPKLDFGLELLYGNNSGPGSSSLPADEKADSGAQIRGTLKYRFPN